MPGVYLFKNTAGKIIYVGKAKSLRDRVATYFQTPGEDLLPKTARLVGEIAKIDHVLTETEIDALLLEANLIRKFKPKYNVSWKDGRSYPLIEITLTDKVPLVRLAHQELNQKAIYFGPYPTGSDITELMRFLRRVWPFVSEQHRGGRACLRSHLGLCPCPGVFMDRKARAKYRRDILDLRKFLEGRRQAIQRRLSTQMSSAAKRQEFEVASEIKQKLTMIDYITTRRTRPVEYEVNPNLAEDRRLAEMTALGNLLGLQSVKKIEGYDVSNISGKSATGAQVVFVDGIPEKRFYRRYKIKLDASPNDVAMISEMLRRRMSSEIPLPELMVIDGGKGQLNAAIAIVAESRAPVKPKVVGLAKRLETIFTDEGGEIDLPENSIALHLIQRLRDEAHRFSRRYHFYLRRKTMLE